MANFQLAPWEVPISGWVPQNGEAVVPLQSAPYSLRVIPWFPRWHIVFARHITDENLGNWLVCEPDALKPKIWRPGKPMHSLPGVARQIQNGELALNRFFVFKNGVHQLGVVLSKTGLGRLLVEGVYPRALFKISLDPADFQLEAAPLYEMLSAQLRDENSPVGFAASPLWSWGRSGGNRLRTYLYGGEEKSRELQEMMRCILIVDRILWQQSLSWIWKVSRHEENFAWLVPQGQRKTVDVKQFSWIAGWSDFLANKLLPTIKAPAMASHLSIAEFEKHRFGYIEVGVRADMITDISKREAAIKLRKWARENHAPASLLALLTSKHTP